MAPVWIGKIVLGLMLGYLGKVELRCVPATNTIICTEVTLYLKSVSRRPIPLKR